MLLSSDKSPIENAIFPIINAKHTFKRIMTNLEHFLTSNSTLSRFLAHFLIFKENFGDIFRCLNLLTDVYHVLEHAFRSVIQWGICLPYVIQFLRDQLAKSEIKHKSL